ncbi:hypothetical protein CY34DRAFT_717558 [Suillus luteus UH-Slu-Lm8-n1]|uniref:CHAT domain-containing protein n=1 Tax=Suillus luteus UH-Slu-Lm8-n1 TaxID=930992 RepID=A0A0D0B011_9AGAM|nr:hypothetical protein CY34DRAFT_717558 [Suillus luteus UH-Slu-Lm8-n1]
MADEVELWRAALQQCLHDHSHQLPNVLENLANSLVCRFQQWGVLSDLDEAVNLHRAALARRAASHPLRSNSLNGLAIALQLRFHQRGVQGDLDEAIKLHRATLALRQPGHPDRPMSLANLAGCLQDRCVRLDVLSDLDTAISLHQAALEICLPSHHLQPQLLHGLADSHLHRFQRGGVLLDLDEAIRLNRAALALCPLGHPDRFGSLMNLANSLVVTSPERHVLPDLDEVVSLHRAALALCPIGHPHRMMSLNNLAVSLGNRYSFNRGGDPSDLDETIELHRDALVLCPPDNPFRPGFLNNLANRLVDKFRQGNVLSDLDEAIETHRAALALCPSGHPDRCASLGNLASSLRVRSEQRKSLSDVDGEIELRRGALALCPPGHFHRSTALDSLARSLQYRSKWQSRSSDMDEAFSLYSQLSQQSHPVSRMDIRAAESWIASAEQADHGSVLVAYRTALRFVDQYVAVLAPSSSHFDVVKKAVSSLAMDAFSCCVRRGALTHAVELVEQGRAVLWTQLARLRTPLDDLSASSATGNTLAEEFRKVSLTLRKVFDAKDESPRIRQLTVQWDDVVSRIRRLPDFSRFLLPPLFSDLQKAAECGPVIIVNGSKYSCDVLIITRDRDPVLVPLDITLAEVKELSVEFQALTRRVGSSDPQLESHKMVGMLRKLWVCVVSPVVQALKGLIDPGSRIWWCPTAEFNLLPLHAAGPYEKKRHNLSHFYVSSYTSTLTALIRARRRVSQETAVQRFVAIGQGRPEGGKELCHVDDELTLVEERVAPFLAFTSLAGVDATVQGASDAMSRAQWLHLACHGVPNRTQPFASSFTMRDGAFTIKDIIRSSSRVHAQNPEFAFLSACHTTVGDESSPDEAICLAAAMQFAGFCSVVGSMWSVDDEVVREVVRAFYDALVSGDGDGGGGRLDCARAAGALHCGMKTLRKKIPLEQQIVFVHIGV